MNIVKEITNRIESRLLETKKPCKLYKKYETAERSADLVALALSNYWEVHDREVQYIIVYVPSVEKYAVSFDINRIIRSAPNGGYVMFGLDGYYTH